jgi:nicotinamidase/pyrazinamidase
MTKKNIALISVDNTRTFEDVSLNELYVSWWEKIAQKTKEILSLIKPFNILTVNVFDNHPQWHISFASSYKNKKPFDTITLEEVEQWTQDDLSDTAQFTIEDLKIYLANSLNQTNRVRIEHGKNWTESHKLMPPLTDNMFDIHIPKGYQIHKHPYWWFIDTKLLQALQERNIDTVFITGVATEYCSGQTVEEALYHNLKTYFITDATAAIDQEAGNKMIKNLESKWAIMINTHQLEDTLHRLL